MTLLTDDGTTVIVTGNRAFDQRARTYNLTVADIRTYYVLAGETPILVHNAGGSDPGPGMANVGRWMSSDEYQKILKTGMVQEGAGGLTYVVSPGNPDAYKPTYRCSIYVEFEVPESSLLPGGRPGDYKMANADTLMGRYLAKKGGTPGMPEAKNIRLGGGGC
ncbi:hypothetical protein AB0P17_18665 [Streptomyces sp. NPDC088124]|uniref:TreTu family toxin n=1 Tax=Streptomyces sp. NPDC088124 TaxID=3154654 RepID=UPI003426A921